MKAGDEIEEDRLTRTDVLVGAWATGTVVVLILVAAYLLEPPLTLARLGEVAGTAAFVLMVFGMVLMIRLPGLAAAAGGLEGLYSLHRGFGLAAYGFMLLHPLLLAQQGGWMAIDLDGKDLWFRLGWTGLLIVMVGLVCTFILKTGGYAIWRRLHGFLVLGFLAAAAHAASYQGDWPLVGRVVFNLLLGVGIAAPLLRYWLIDRGGASTLYRVEAVGRPAREVIDMRLSPVGEALLVQPGQFVFARFAAGGVYPGCGHFHPFTASRLMEGGVLRLSIKASGPCSRDMQKIEPGTLASLQGPYGDLFQHARQDSHVWIAGGIGIAPFVARLRSLEPTHAPIRLLYFFDTPDEAAYVDEIAGLVASRPRCNFHPVPIHGQGEVIETTLDALLPPWNDKHYILCGPEGFANFIRAYLIAHGVGDEGIFQERLEHR